MQKRKATLLFAILLVSLLTFLPTQFIPAANAASPSLVGTSTTAYATSNPFQRKTFYANGRFWAFYSDGTNIVYSTSTDGVTWTSPTAIHAASSGARFSVWFDGTYIHYAVATYIVGEGLFYRRGVPNADGSITWSDAEQSVIPGIGDVYYYRRAANAGVAEAPDLWVMDGSYSDTANYTTEIVTGTTAALNCYSIKPFANNTVSIGTELPTTITLQGWRTSTPVNLTTPLATSGFFISGYLKNRAAVAHAGYIYARLWKSPYANMSNAVALTGWLVAPQITFSATAGEEKPFTIQLPVSNPPNNEYLYVEFAWKISTAATDPRAGFYLRADTISDYVDRSAQAFYNPYVSVDSNGYPYIAFLHIYYKDGTGYYPYIIKSSLNNGTWATASGFPYQLSTLLISYYSVIPLTGGKMLAIYAYDGLTIRARAWNGTAWLAEVATSSALKSYYFSAVSQGDDVHLVFLKASTYDIIYTKYSYASNGFPSETTLVAGATSSSAPVITIDPSTNDLYVFATTKTTGTPSGWTANHIYYIKYSASSGTWGSWTDWIDESSEVLYSADRLTGFYQAYCNYIGLAYLTKTSSPYNVKFASILLFPLRLPAYGTTISFAENLTASNIQCFNDKIILINASLGSEPEKADVTIAVKNANLTISQLSHNKKFIAELNGPTGTLAELTITHSLYTHMPGTVAVAGLPLTMPCSTKEDFDKYGGNTWYYDTTTNTVYIKAVLHSPTSIYIDWNPPPAPALIIPTPTPTPTPTPQPTITPPTIPSWAPVFIIALIIIALLMIRKRL